MNIQPGLYDAIIKYGEAKLQLGMELAIDPFSAKYKDLMDLSSAAFKRVDQCILDLYAPVDSKQDAIPDSVIATESNGNDIYLSGGVLATLNAPRARRRLGRSYKDELDQDVGL